MELGELAGTDYRMVADMAAFMAKKGVGFYGSQGWTGEGGVWEWDSRTSPNRGSRGKLQMEEEALQRRWKCKRQLEGAEGEGASGLSGVRGWVEDEEDEEDEEEKADRMQQQRQHQRRNQVQEQEATMEGHYNSTQVKTG